MSDSQEVAAVPAMPSGREIGAFASESNFVAAQRMAKALVSAELVPKMYQGDKNLCNAIIALEMAQRMGASPLMVMQNLYMVHGNPGWSAKFLIATFNQCGRFTAIRYEWKGDEGATDYGCRAFAHEKNTGQPVYGPWITWDLVKSEGWDSKAGSKWKTMPEKMFMYRAAAWMVDAIAPEISMGLPTAEENRDIIDVDASTGEVLGVVPAAPLTQTQTANVADKLKQKVGTEVEPETAADLVLQATIEGMLAEGQQVHIEGGEIVDSNTGEIVTPASIKKK
jgi:hypothetical protein